MFRSKLAIKMDAAIEKQVKEQLNEAEQSSSDEKGLKDDPKTDEGENQSLKSLQHIQEIFAKTEAMKEVAKGRNKELEEQFKDLKQRLNSSSEYLQRIKKNIENIKFSYQRNVLELHKNLDPASAAEHSKFRSKDEMTGYIEDIRKKIDDLQNRMTAQKEKQQHVTENYEEAFDRVINTLQLIESGSYSSNNLLGE